MSKTEVYSWRISPELKNLLEEAARAEGQSLACLLERITTAWLEQQKAEAIDADIQEHIRNEAMKYVGSVRGEDPLRAQQASQRVKAILLEKNARHRSS